MALFSSSVTYFEHWSTNAIVIQGQSCVSDIILMSNQKYCCLFFDEHKGRRTLGAKRANDIFPK